MTHKYIRRTDRRRLKHKMALLGITVAVAGVGFLSYSLGYSNAKVSGAIELKNTEDALASHYDSALEVQADRAQELVGINMKLRKELSDILNLRHILLTYRSEKFNVSAYTLREQECGRAITHPDYGVTASGELVQEWYTVAAPKSIPFGTVLFIPYFKDKPNHGIFVVTDRGGAIVEGHLDVYMPELEDAEAFGRQDLEVYVLK